jgi:predicted DNA-binding transcriptional regulator YafY
MTADALAAELEVSVRTIYRDMEALHQAGVALYGEAGRDGGYRLVDGYRTHLTGLTRLEAEALWLVALPGAARDLGLGPAAAGAATKLKAALSDDLRQRADHMQGRLHIDSFAWYDDADSTPLLAAVADAVWHQRRLRVRYHRWQAPSEVDRVLDPYGLVLKAGRWYLVASTQQQLRTYRVSQLSDVQPVDERFERPAAFDLAAYWRDYLADFDVRRHRQVAVVRLSAAGLRLLAHYLEPAIVRAASASLGTPDDTGWVRASIPIETISNAHDHLLRLGAEVEVLEPDELRAAMARTAGAMARRYAA